MTIPARKGHNHTRTTGRRLLIKQEIDTTYQSRASVVAVSTDLRGLPSNGRIDVKFLSQNCGGEKPWMRCVQMTCMLTQLVAPTGQCFSRFFNVLAEDLKGSKAVRALCKPPSNIVVGIKNQCSSFLLKLHFKNKQVFSSSFHAPFKSFHALSSSPGTWHHDSVIFGQSFAFWLYSGYPSTSRS